MPELNSIGLLELTSVAIGHVALDSMLKTAPVEVLLARSICSGKYLIAVAGDVASTTAAVDVGARLAPGALIEKRVISRLHPAVFPAIAQAVDVAPSEIRALGIIETFSAASIIDVADTVMKAADVTLLRIHLAMALGGKGFVVMTGDVSSIEAAVEAGCRVAASEGMLVARGVIAAPRKELFRDWI
ncbi:MAG TPA: BMC domain-containing protein [Bryobacteraceae bacterium]|nr:BMC domain-containing protein [Bryobacteraceae bacterium]